MTQTQEFSSDLREIILMDEGAQIQLTYGGRVITGTRGNLLQSATYDIGGGGIEPSIVLTATFVFSDFPNTPDGTEIVSVDGRQLRIHRVTVDDFRAGIAVDFTNVLVE